MQKNPGTVASRRVTRHWPWVSGVVALVVAIGLGALIFVRHNGPFLFDSAWMGEILEHRNAWLDVPAYALTWIGGGWFAWVVVPVGTILALVFLKKRWAALYYGLAVLLSVLVVQVLKALFDRPRPEDILVMSDIGSFPSGHVANAATIAITLALILGRAWIWYAGVAYTVLMALSRTYLGAHWLSDTIGGALIGAGIAVIVWAPLASRLDRERKRSPATDSEQLDLGSATGSG